MLVNLEEVEARLDSPDNILNKLEVRNHYTNLSGPKRSFNERVEAGAIANSTSVRKAAEITGYSEAHIKDLKRGLTNHNSPQNAELAKAIEAKIDNARDTAVDKLMEALGLLTTDKMSECDAKELSSISANMAKVATVGARGANGSNMNVLIYAPKQKGLDEFDVIDI